MDSRTFDRLARLLGATGSRRQSLAAVIGAALGGILGVDEADARAGSRERRASAAGPCGDGSRKDNRCTSDKQCCTGICDVELGKRNKDKVGRCRCFKNGTPCKADKNCCKTSVCFKGSCANCRKKNQSCEETGDCCGTNVCTNGTCVPCGGDGQACAATADCCSGLACYNGACAPCISDGKACASTADCCSGLACYNGACAPCVSDGKACANDGECCSGAVCRKGACATPKTVKSGDPCIADFDSCEDPDAWCNEYEFDEPAGTYCVLPRKAACTSDLQCFSRDCENRVCIGCSFDSCITPCSPIVCKSGCTHSTIQAAVNAADSYDTIDIGEGTYEEDLVIGVSVALRACKGAPVTIRNKTYDARTIRVINDRELALIDIVVDGRNDLENQRYGGGIASDNFVGLFRNSVVRNGAWDFGGGIKLGSEIKGFTKQAKAGSAPGRFARNFARAAERSLGERAGRAVRASRADRGTVNPANNPSDAVAVVDQSSVQYNSATYYGGGIFASYNGTPAPYSAYTPDGPMLAVALFGDGEVRDNQVTSTDAPRGVTLQGQAYYGGGGIYSVNAYMVLLEDARIHQNIGDFFGGGVMAFPPNVEHFLVMDDDAGITGNKAYMGGGAAVLSGTGSDQQYVDIEGNAVISGNSADRGGGGLYLDGVPLYLDTYASVSNNHSESYGGGAYIGGPFGVDTYGLRMDGHATIAHNTSGYAAGVGLWGAWAGLNGFASITFNTAQLDGGGVYLEYDDGDTEDSGIYLNEYSSITYNIAGDSGAGRGGGVFSDDASNEVHAYPGAITSNNPDDYCLDDGNGGCIV